MIHIIYLIFGSNVIIFRIFSVIAIILLGILGYTHIRKDFGEKTGILFSFLTYFLPIMCLYAQEIRMYSWSCLLVTLMAIYVYRFYKDKQTKNLIIFGIFSISSCYIHYYALVTAFLINLMLLIYLIKNIKECKQAFIQFIILAVVQVVLYIPWLIYLLIQIAHVGTNYWIKNVTFVDRVIGILSVQFQTFKQSNVELEHNIQTYIALIIAILTYIYIGYRIYKDKKEKEDIKPAIFSIIVYWGVIAIVSLISVFMSILFSRYLIIMTGIYIFTIAFVMSKEKRTWITYIICAIFLVLGIASNLTNTLTNYDESNMKHIEYMQENIQKDDIIVYSNIMNGGVIAAFFPNNKQYFYNFEYWQIDEAYKSYGPGMEVVYDYHVDDYHGRIWIIDSAGMNLWEEFPKEGITILEEAKCFETAYQGYIYNIILVEKE